MEPPMNTHVTLQIFPAENGGFGVHWALNYGAGSIPETGTAVFVNEEGLRVWLANLAKKVRR